MGTAGLFQIIYLPKNVMYFLFSPLGFACYFHVTWKLTYLANRSSREYEKSSTHLSSGLCRLSAEIMFLYMSDTRRRPPSSLKEVWWGSKSLDYVQPLTSSLRNTQPRTTCCAVDQSSALCHALRALQDTSRQPNRGRIKVGAKTASVLLQTTNQQVCSSAKFPSDICLNKGFVNFH